MPQISGGLNSSACRYFRGALSRISGALPVFLPELFLILLPVFAFLIFRMAMKLSLRELASIVLLISTLIFSTYSLTLGFAYRANPLSERIGILQDGKYSESDVESALISLTNRISDVAADARDFSFDAAVSAIGKSYSDFCEKYPVLDEYTPTPKPISLAPLASLVGILGIYFPLTAEVGINTAQPQYSIPFTIAHELAHAKGVAREDEANFLAFAICADAPDPFVRYSGYLGAFEIVGAELYKINPSAYFDIASLLPERAISDLCASSQFIGLADNSVSDALATLNDAHLKSATGTGSLSYTLALDLIISYLIRR